MLQEHPQVHGHLAQRRTRTALRVGVTVYVKTCKMNWLDDFLTGGAPLLEGASQDDEEDGNGNLG